jgi:Na+-transporting NADH:ubiquinone oxidoreductase subunit F
MIMDESILHSPHSPDGPPGYGPHSLAGNFRHTVRINGGVRNVIVNTGEKLLSGLTAGGIYIPSACGGRGSCGYCRVRAPSAGTAPEPAEIRHLSAEDITGGIRLACQMTVRSDLEIEIPDELLSVRKFRGKLISKRHLTHDIAELRIECVEPASLGFIAGQYVQLHSSKYMGREPVMRAYSISSPPSGGKYFELIIRRVPDGICTTWVFDYLKEGRDVTFSGPYGSFFLSGTRAPVIFIAGGSGMAPIWSMMRDMADKGIRRKTVFFFGALTQKDLFYTGELAAFAKEQEWFTFVPSLSNEPAGSDWNGERGLVTEVVSRLLPDTSRHEAYLCGSPGMIDASVAVLIRNGIPADKIHYDKFA